MTTPATAIAFGHVENHFRFFASSLHRVKEALHPAVTSFGSCGGIVDLDAPFAESILRPGGGNGGLRGTCAVGGAGLANEIDGFSGYDGGVA